MWEIVGETAYYYTYRCSGGRVQRIYVGHGPMADLMAAQDEQRRAERQNQRNAWATAQTECDKLLPPVLDINDHTNLLAVAVLYAAGCHRLQRRWRYRLDRAN